MHYFQLNNPDWSLSTAHLTVEEEGIYWRLIRHYYDTESPIPEETQSVFRRLRLGGHEEAAQAILEEFFVLKGGKWRHERCDREIAAYQKKASTNRENGKKGGRPKKEKPEETQSVSGGMPDKTLTKNQEPLTNNHKPDQVQGDSPPEPSESERVPFSKILDLYHRTLPELPACKKLTDTRKGYIRQRHIEDIHDLDQWERYFMAVSRSDFLMGRKPGSGDRPPFRADLEWLTRPSNFAKVAEGKYHRV